MKKKKVRIYKKPNQMQQPMFNMGGKMYSEPELISMYPDAYKQYQMAYGGNIPQHGFGEWLGKNAGTIGAVAGGVGGFFVAGPAGVAAGAKLGSMAGGKIQEKYEAKQAAELEAQQQAELAAQQPNMLGEEACNCEEPRREATSTNTFAMGGSLKCMKCGGKTHYPDGGIITTTDSKGNIMLGRTKDNRSSVGKGYSLQGLVFNPNTGKVGGRAELNSNIHRNNKFNQAFIEAGRVPGGAYGDFGFKTGKGGDFYLGNKKLSGNTYLSGNVGTDPNSTYGGAGIGGNILIPIGRSGFNIFGQGDLGFKYSETGNYDSDKSTKLDGGVTAGIRYKFEEGGPIKGKFTKNTKRQEKRAAKGKKGRYIKEGPLTVEEARLLDEKYPYTSSEIPMIMIPNDFYDSDFGTITGNEIVEGQFNKRARDEERIRRKRNFNTSDGVLYDYFRQNGIDPYTQDIDLLSYADGGAIQSPQYEAEGGEVIQADGMQIHGGGGNPNLSYRANGGAMINGVDHKADSADPNSGVKLSSSGSTDGRIFSKRLKNPATKKPFATEADALLKKVGKYEKIVKDNKSESIARRTAQIMADKYNAQLDELFEAQESLKQEQGIQDSSLGTDEAVGAAKAEAMGALPEGTPTQATLDIMKQQMAGIPAEQVMPQIPMGAMGGKLPQHATGAELAALQQGIAKTTALLNGNFGSSGSGDSSGGSKFGSFLGATAPLPTAIFDLVGGLKDPYQWEKLQNAQQANALGMYDQAKAGLGTMGDTIADMDTQALKDFQASRDIYNQMGDLDVSQQRADVKSGTGNMMNALRGGAGSRQELLAGSQNIFNQQTAKLGQVEGYKNQFDAEQQARRAAGLEGLGGREAAIRAQKAGLLGQQAGMFGQLGGLYNQIGQQERDYLQSINELDRQERDLKYAKLRSSMAGFGNMLGDFGSAFTGEQINSEIA